MEVRSRYFWEEKRRKVYTVTVVNFQQQYSTHSTAHIECDKNKMDFNCKQSTRRDCYEYDFSFA